MKQRFTTTDVSAEVACLRAQCLGMRVANIYDISPRIYLFKLARSGEDGEKVFLLMESGTRFHTTQVLKDRPPQPSNFCLKLRKHIRSRRLEDVRQLGVDRIVDFTFGTGEATHHVLLELYSAGNVILTDGRYEVLTLLRSHRDDARGMATLPRHPYPLGTIRLDEEVGCKALASAFENGAPDATLRSALGATLPYGPQVTDRCLTAAGLRPTARIADVSPDASQLEALRNAVAHYQAWVASLDDKLPAGVIGLAKPGESRKQRAAAAAAAAEASAKGLPAPPEQEVVLEDLVYDDYEPVVTALQGGQPTKSFPTFDAALAEFYSKVEGQRAGVQQATAKKQVLSKLDKARTEQEERVAALGREADAEEDQAALIEYNLSVVDAAIDALNAALARGLDWRDLAALIENEKAAGNPVAKTVANLHLERNAAVLLLRNELDVPSDSDDDGLRAPPPPPTRIEVDLSMNAAANARVRHEARKRHTAKQRRTADAATRVMAAAEKKTAAQLAQVEKKATVLTAVRKPAWFERFAWFVSSENFLVISGRDTQQTDLLVNRYLRKGDVFVHADLKGALPTIIKNNDPAVPVPPLTISQAGAACVCHSSAWGAKIVTSAWWVSADQVTKAAVSGKALTAASFTIEGTRRFLPPHPLIMGLGFLFVVDDDSAAAHSGERLIKSGDVEADGGACEEALPDAEAGAAAAATSGNVSDGLSDRSTSDAATPSATSRPSESANSHADEGSADVAASATVAAVATLCLGSSGSGAASGGDSSSSAAEVDPSAAAARTGGGGGDDDEGGVGSRTKTALDNFMDSGADPHATDFSRYGLTDLSASSTAGAESADVTDEVALLGQAARHVSAAARRAAKKQGLPPGSVSSHHTSTQSPTCPPGSDGNTLASDAAEASEVTRARASERAAREAKQQAKAAGPPGPTAPAARGTRGKARKMTRQYGDQDEEDRQLAMAALASAGSKKVKGDRKEARKARKDARRPQESAPGPLPTADELAAVNARPIDTRRNWGWEHRESGNAAVAASASLARHADGASASADVALADQRENSAGGSTDDEDDERKFLQRDEEDRMRLTHLLAHMTGVPREGDTLECALPVCAPYQVMAAYRYKVKLTPGSQKKGKAARQGAGLLVGGHGVPTAHSDAMLSVPEAETIAACIGGVKISVPGLQASKVAAKKGKKGKK